MVRHCARKKFLFTQGSETPNDHLDPEREALVRPASRDFVREFHKMWVSVRWEGSVVVPKHQSRILKAPSLASEMHSPRLGEHERTDVQFDQISGKGHDGVAQTR